MKLFFMIGLLCFEGASTPAKTPVVSSGPEIETKASFEPTPCILIFAY